MINTYFLRFPDEETAKSILSQIGIYIETAPATDTEPSQGYYRDADIGWAFDLIGTITKGGEWDPETGEEITPPIEVPGWHANYAAKELPPELEPYNLDPKPSTPSRVFF